MLAYAAQGLRVEPRRRSQIRNMLMTCEKSLDGLAEVFTQIVRTDNLQPVSLEISSPCSRAMPRRRNLGTARPGAAVNQLADGGQPQCVDPLARAAYRLVLIDGSCGPKQPVSFS
jgi:hypothetical protein